MLLDLMIRFGKQRSSPTMPAQINKEDKYANMDNYVSFL